MTASARWEDLTGKRILVTGASSGIGLACVRRLLEEGARVAAHFHSQPSPVEALEKEHPGRVVAVRADLSTEEGCVEACRAAVSGLAGLDGLVHSAGIWNDGPIRELSRQTLEHIFRVNTFSAYYLARECSRAMSRGSLVFIGSTAGQRGEPGHSHYAGSKGAMQSMVYSLAQELAPSIRVNLVSPGWVRTPMSEEALRAREAAIVARVPLRRVAEAEDVAEAALFLLSDASRHFTGADLCCSGGALLPMPRG
jgi:3-oxoacyl-[acyl-carrier protein] reductase